MGEYRRLKTIGGSFGIESFLLTPSETKSKFPFINEQIIEGSLYIPGCGVVNPQALCQGLVQAATQSGAKVNRTRFFGPSLMLDLYVPTNIPGCSDSGRLRIE